MKSQNLSADKSYRAQILVWHVYRMALHRKYARMRIATHSLKTFQRNQSGYEYDVADFHLHHPKVHFVLLYRKSSFFPDFLIFLNVCKRQFCHISRKTIHAIQIFWLFFVSSHLRNYSSRPIVRIVRFLQKLAWRLIRPWKTCSVFIHNLVKPLVTPYNWCFSEDGEKKLSFFYQVI